MAHLKPIEVLMISLRVFVKVDVVLGAREIWAAQRFLVDEDARSGRRIRLRKNQRI